MHTDADIWKALQDVELKHIATGPRGLEFVVFANGANFSAGEVNRPKDRISLALMTNYFLEATSVPCTGHSTTEQNFDRR